MIDVEEILARYEPNDRPTDRVNALFYHNEQWRLWNSPARFRVVPAGRRSGKTEHAIRFLAKKAMLYHEDFEFTDGKFILGAPTRDQAKRLFWKPIKGVIPDELVDNISESELTLTLVNGVRICVVGFDKPMRAEGEAIDGAVLDEYADMKPEAWTQTIRPALGTRGRHGWCWFIGKPRGRNHYWKLYTEALKEEKTEWDGFHWSSEDILEESEIASLKDDLDPVTYDQEIRANFVDFSGRVYYAFHGGVQDSHVLEYDRDRPLDITLDFNVEPGTATISQDLYWKEKTVWPEVMLAGEMIQPWIQGDYTAYLDEIWIAQNSNTLHVCKELIRRWGTLHQGTVNFYGDATGGARKTSATTGTDWDIVKRECRKVKGWHCRFRVPSANPPERDRVNAMNARLMASDGRVRCMVDPVNGPHLIEDFEGVVAKDGTGAIDKSVAHLTHLSDGTGYKHHRKHPVKSLGARVKQL